VTTKPSVFVSELLFSDGNNFQFTKEEKIILVGPNNSGKSQSLKEILGICGDGKTGLTVVIKKLSLSKNGDQKDLASFLNDQAEHIGEFYRHNSWQIHENHISLWDAEYLTGNLLNGFVKIISANARLAICEQQNSISTRDQKTKPQHILYDNELLMTEISTLFKDAFGKELMFDFRGGSKLPIHVGDLPSSEIKDRVSDEYVGAVRNNPLLDMQGDGMKSYAGILFEAIVNSLDITLIDEPEAFLHPPQMRKLGETLAKKITGQLFIATHSSDVLRGFLEGTQGNLRILRISRDGSSNIVREASSSTLKDLWEKPELRYSNALEGVFHEQAVICEHDGDCRLINAVADYLASTSKERWLDTAYVPTGGKHGIAKVADILRKVGVPIKAVFDIDFLNDETLVEKTVKAFGGDWNAMSSLWKRVNSAVSNGNKPKTNKEIKQDITKLINDSEEDSLPKSDISEALKQGKAWHTIKKYGENAIPNGAPRKDYNSLIAELQKIGIYIIPVGEIENFCPQIGLHGPKFITKLLSEFLLSDNELSGLREFVSKVHKGSHGVLE
jgi:energy-coupling factor transporter ATP-binding protein EcfA2